MKKIIGLGVAVSTVTLLVGCSNNQSYNSNDQATISSLKREVKSLKSENKKLRNEKATCNQTSENETSENTSAKSESIAFGKAAPLTDAQGDNFVVTVLSAQTITDRQEGLIADLAANYDQLNKFVIFTYKVTALSDGFDPDIVDGSNLTYLDADGSRGTVSSNRDSTGDGTLNKGESATMRIGVGFESTGNKVSVRAANYTWTGEAK